MKSPKSRGCSSYTVYIADNTDLSSGASQPPASYRGARIFAFLPVSVPVFRTVRKSNVRFRTVSSFGHKLRLRKLLFR
jgi:hypothetical protein